jgi:hypothetical protein
MRATPAELLVPSQRKLPRLRWPRLTRLPLPLEITLALLIKALILTLLWKVFFAHPQAQHMHMPLSQVEQHLLPASAVPAVAQPSPHSENPNHTPTKAEHERSP